MNTFNTTNYQQQRPALLADERGMTSVEYALGALAATALAGALYFVAQSQAVRDAIEQVVTGALSNVPG
ncbi:DUF4244 domain-containing protein [Corynebacterium kozikiae]|uniref:DUF4244 domain-containing protein n=1 Tax=Corynebacterium kozikiae TaxID=2968469 RepID=UPI00211C9F02|nr:DUF4244 domain-containing protein [Corynebacterium sp. 76QC2CO]MCQ9342717.1 DUF4244 domain-containing protein [Corynebacterium sp. 76QC2CO]